MSAGSSLQDSHNTVSRDTGTRIGNKQVLNCDRFSGFSNLKNPGISPKKPGFRVPGFSQKTRVSGTRLPGFGIPSSKRAAEQAQPNVDQADNEVKRIKSSITMSLQNQNRELIEYLLGPDSCSDRRYQTEAVLSDLTLKWTQFVSVSCVFAIRAG